MAETPTVPTWADFFSPEQLTTFLETLQAALEDRGMVSRVDVAEGVAAFTEPGDEGTGEPPPERAFAMRGMAYLCAESGDTARYREVIDFQIDQLLVGYSDNVAAAELDDDWEQARGAIMPRLFPLGQALENKDILVFRPIAPDLAAVLVYDLPDSVFSVEPETAASWPVPLEDVWDVAIQNLRNEVDVPNVDQIALGEEAQGLMVYGDSFFVTSRILLLGDILSAEEFPDGAVVILPHRHAMAFHPITSAAQTMAAINELILLAREMFEEGPGSLSADLYWWRPGRIELIPVQIDDAAEELLIDPPQEFLDLLERLGADASAEAADAPAPAPDAGESAAETAGAEDIAEAAPSPSVEGDHQE